MNKRKEIIKNLLTPVERNSSYSGLIGPNSQLPTVSHTYQKKKIAMV